MTKRKPRTWLGAPLRWRHAVQCTAEVRDEGGRGAHVHRCPWSACRVLEGDPVCGQHATGEFKTRVWRIE